MHNPNAAGDGQSPDRHQNTTGRTAMFPKPVRSNAKKHEARFVEAMQQVRGIIRTDLVEQIVERVGDPHIGGRIWSSADGTGMEFIYSCTDDTEPVVVTRNWAQIFCVSSKEEARKVLADLSRFVEDRPEEDWHREP